MSSLRGRLRVLGEPLVPRRRRPTSRSSIRAAPDRPEAAKVLVAALVTGIWAGTSKTRRWPPPSEAAAIERDHGGLLRMVAGGPTRDASPAPNGLTELTDALAEAVGPRLCLGARVTKSSASHAADSALPSTAPPARRLPSSRLPRGSLRRCLRTSMAPGGGGRGNPGGRRRGLASGVHPREAGTSGIRFPHTPWESASVLGSRSPNLFPVAPLTGTSWRRSCSAARAILGRRGNRPRAHQSAASALAKFAGIRAAPRFALAIRHPRAIPQYARPRRSIGAVAERLRELPTFLAGNSYRGIAINSYLAEAPSIAEAWRRSAIRGHSPFLEQRTHHAASGFD
jgi:hypothetical protein